MGLYIIRMTQYYKLLRLLKTFLQQILFIELKIFKKSVHIIIFITYKHGQNINELLDIVMIHNIMYSRKTSLEI